MRLLRACLKTKLISAAVVATLTVASMGAYTSGVFGSSPVSHAAANTPPTSVSNFVVWIGGGHGNDDFTNAMYTPDTVNIWAGDSVTFRTVDRVEPHTVTFGPKKMLNRLANSFISVVPNKAGPPSIRISTQATVATKRRAYNGTGFANSGVLSADYHGITKTSWTIRFTKPGTYVYHCLIHYPFMRGEILVRSRSLEPIPGTPTVYRAIAGYVSAFTKTSSLIADTFFPETLTIHAGDTVKWAYGFHTITLAPASTISHLRSQFLIRTWKNGKPIFTVNPQIAFPSSTNGCGPKVPCVYTGGFLSSGIAQGNGPGTFEVTFPKPGVYHYGCLVHRGMDGQITVLP